jgi:hypothetical protein
VREEKPVEAKDEGDGQRLVALEAHQRIGRIPVAGKLALIAVAITIGALRDPLSPIALDDHSLDCVRSGDRCDSRVLGEAAEQFGHLIFEEAFSPLSRVDPRQHGTQLAAQRASHSAQRPTIGKWLKLAR